MNIADVRKNLSDALNRVAYAQERIVLERRGKGVAVLVSMEDFATLERLEAEADVRAARIALKSEGEIPLADIKARLGMS